ncbi:MAG: multidrug DMT transporter permease, partial [Oscillospiraceae bacterium]
MWICLALGSAFFAGVTSILAKCGIKETESNVATAIRTIVVFLFSWIMVFVAGSYNSISVISSKSWVFLILS